MHDYSNKTVFVAGGTQGLNFGIADAFAKAGARVAVCSRSQDKVDAAVTKLKAHGKDALGFACDVRQYDAVSQALAKTHERFGEIDVLVSGAAGNFPAPALALSPNGFRAVVDIDLVGTFHVLRAGFEHLKKPGASVINITAQQGSQPVAMQAHACAAKAGVDQLTRVLAIEWGAAGVRVNAISPGPIENTGGMERLAPSGDVSPRIAEGVPLARVGTHEDIAECALFLSSKRASYITGAIVPVDGGMSLYGGGLFGQVLTAAFAEQSSKR
ncbi:MAG: SDR family oxidoreductase [Deltaproteobacteria bacterium]|nr:SDR family oxidoreductase [Deltaproteobacteria bacterium]